MTEEQQQRLDENQQTIERAIFGAEVDNFMHTQIGEYIKNRSESMKSDSIKKLCACDPENPGMIRELQNQVYVAESIVQWMQDAILDGLKAVQILDSRE